jgi:hypothetical protein
MSVLDRLNKLITITENAQPITNANELVEHLKSVLAPKVGKNFFNVCFDKTENGTGTVFVKFAKHPMQEATNQKIQECPVNFIIAIEGFLDNGSVCQECGGFDVEMYRFQDKTNNLRKMRTQKLPSPMVVRDYVNKYFEKFSKHLTEDGAPAPAAPAAAPASTGPAVPDGFPSVAGGTTSDKSIAKFYPRTTRKITRRDLPKLKKK